MIVNLSIPKNARIKVSQNTRVDFNDPLFEIVDEEIVNINIAEKIKVKPDQMFRHLTCIVGDRVKNGIVIAKKTTFFSSSEFICEYEGILQNINHQDGTIDIKIQKSERRVINAFFKGVIEKIEKFKIQVDIDAPIKIELEEASTDFGGPIFNFREEHQYFTMTEDEVKNHVVITKEMKTNILAKFKALEAVGYVFQNGEIDPSDKYAKIVDIAKFAVNKKNCLISNLDKTIYVY